MTTQTNRGGARLLSVGSVALSIAGLVFAGAKLLVPMAIVPCPSSTSSP